MQPAVRRYVDEAQRHHSMGKSEQAEAILLSGLAAHPRQTPILVALGIVSSQIGKREQAAEYFKRALAVDPNNVTSLCWLSAILPEFNQLEVARRYAERAVSLAPQAAATQASLGQCLMKLGLQKEAIPYFQEAVRLDPNNPSSMFALADMMIATGQDHQAANALRQAIGLKPNPRAYLTLANLEAESGKIEDAEKYCQLAIKSEPNHASAHLLMGRILTEQFKFEEAETHWKLACEHKAEPSSVSLEKAYALGTIGQFDGAQVELRRSIEAKPGQGAAYQALVFSKRIVPDDLPLIHKMEGLVPDESVAKEERLNLLYSLGKSFDNLGQYEKAIGYFDQANVLRNQIHGSQSFDWGAVRSVIDASTRLFSDEFFEEWKRERLQTSLPILVVGMIRSGTTLAEQMLSCHPLAGGAGEQYYWGENEASFVDHGRLKVNASKLLACATEYLEILSSISPEFPHVVDKNPSNFMVLGSMHLAFPNMRIIHIRRNPLDTALSIWTTPMSNRAAFFSDRRSIVEAYKSYLRIMDHWRTVLPSDRLLEIQYEDLVAEPETYVRRIVDFCGLEWDEACLHPELNKRRIKTPSFWQARQPIYKSSTERWKNYEPWLGVFEELRGLG